MNDKKYYIKLFQESRRASSKDFYLTGIINLTNNFPDIDIVKFNFTDEQVEFMAYVLLKKKYMLNKYLRGEKSDDDITKRIKTLIHEGLLP